MTDRDEAIRAHIQLRNRTRDKLQRDVVDDHLISLEIPYLLAEKARLTAELAAMSAALDGANARASGAELAEQALRLQTGAMVKDRDAWRARAEAAEADIRDMLYESSLLVDDGLCVWCERYSDAHKLCYARDCKAECKWRGPAAGEGAKEDK